MKPVRSAWMTKAELKDRFPDIYYATLELIEDAVAISDSRMLFMITLEAEAEKDLKKRSDKMIAVNEKKGRRDEKMGKGKVRR